MENPVEYKGDPREPQHYRLPITPVEFIQRNGLDFCQGNIIKYICRFRVKNGIEDLRKARHYIDFLIRYEYGDECEGI